MGQQKSFAIRTFNTFWVYTMPFVGAIIADCWLGRYDTILVFSLIYLYVQILLIYEFISISLPASVTRSLLAPLPLLPFNTPTLLSVD